MRCDLHVHSLHSGTLPVAVLRHFFQESYSAPIDVYSTLRKRGMDLVTLTDHDSIGGGEDLRKYPDFFLSEEVTCRMPSGTWAHVGVYDVTERQHIEISRRRNDIVRLVAYLSEQRLFFTVNHVFSSLTGRRKADDYEWFSGFFPAVEARNGQMLPSANQQAAEFAWRRCKTQVAGSDAHALRSVGTTYTEVPGARNKDEFFAGLRAGYGQLGGESGSYWKLTRDVLLLC
ncbi:MAG: PHP-associated domain-containing protein, partial [Candidatus Acidiferrales bacterium]